MESKFKLVVQDLQSDKEVKVSYINYFIYFYIYY